MTEWTSEQKKILETTGNTLVYASAGSGKTTVMVNKIVNLLEQIPIERILVLSYTNASAQDMKLKIVKSLSSRLEESKSEILIDQFDKLSFADIGTMDSFCGKLIRENFNKLNVSPKCQQMDEIEANEMKQRIISEVISKEYEKKCHDFMNVMTKTTGIVDDTPLNTIILKLFEEKSIRPNPKEYIDLLKNCASNDKDGIYGKEIINYYRELAKNTLPYVERLSERFNNLKKDHVSRMRLDDIISNLVSISNISDSKSVNDLVYVDSSNGKRITNDEKELIGKENADLIYDIKESVKKKIFDGLRNTLLADYTGYNVDEINEFIDVVIRILDEFEDAYKKEKDKSYKLDFNDLSRLALTLLSDDATRMEIQKKYDIIFVDEYQDINPMQEAILQKISSGDNLFMVGDVKQSIYAFRNADSKIFSEKKDGYETIGGGVALPMTENFRSEKYILKFVDELFSSIMSKDVGGVDYSKESKFLKTNDKYDKKVEIIIYAPTMQDRNIELNGVYSVKNHVQSANEEKEREYLEGLNVAEKIKELIKTENILISGNADKKEYRKPTFSDFAILFRKRTGGASGFLEALEDSGIPTISEGFREDAGEKYIKELISLLRSMSNSRNDIFYAGYLLSFFGAMDENDLNEIRYKNPNNTISESVEKIKAEGTSLGAKCKKAFEFLEECRSRIAYQSIKEFLDEIVSSSGFDIYSASGLEGVEGYYAVKSFIKNSTQMGENVTEFLDYIDNAGIPEIIAESDGSENAVKIVTVHGSKGIEYNYVFVVRTDASWSNPKANASDIIFDKQFGAGMQLYNESERSKMPSLSYNAIKLKQKREEVDENLRLLYVALTRAKLGLYITACKNGGMGTDAFYPKPIVNASSFYDVIATAMADNDYIRSCKMEIEINNVESSKINPEKYIFGTVNETIREELSKVFDQNDAYEYKDSLSISPKYSVTMLNRIDNAEEQKVPYVLVDEPNRRNLGIDYHAVMERIDFNYTSTAEIDYFIKKLAEEGIISDENVDRIDSKKILKAINNPVVKDGIKCKYIREKSFTLRVSAEEIGFVGVQDKVLVQGTIDLAFFGENPTLIDFKYSSLKDEELKEKYRKQLELYKVALLKAYNLEKVKVLLYSFNSGNFIEIE